MTSLRKALFAAPLVFLFSCSGDSRPLTEAVETSQLNLASISIVPPAGSLSPLVLDIGQAVTFTLAGINSDGESVTVPSSDRRWLSSSPSVATIGDDGTVSPQSPGITQISVRVGGVASNNFELTVSDAILSEVDAIIGPDSVDRCDPVAYTATGVWSDGTRRLLGDVAWSIDDSIRGNIEADSSGSVTLNAVNTGAIELTATAGDKMLAKTIIVNDTLQEIRIIPETIVVSVGRTLLLNAEGKYVEGEATRTQLITGAVQWRLVENTPVASIDNTTELRGELTGLESGSTTVDAYCGNLLQSAQVVVVAGTDTLSFSRASPVLVALTTGSFTLKLSTGSPYSDTNDVTKDATWEIVPASDVISISGQGTDTITVTLEKVGTATVRATQGNNSADLKVEVE